MVPKPTKLIAMHLGQWTSLQWTSLQLFLKLLHSPDLDVGWKERESGRPCVEPGEERLRATFSTWDTALLELVAFLRCKLSRTEFLSVPLGHFQTWGEGGGGLGVCESVLEFMGSIFCKSQREQGWEAYCADKRFLLSTQELLTAQIVPVEFKGKRGSSGRPTWACLFIFRVSMAPRCPSSGGGQNSSPIPTPASSP